MRRAVAALILASTFAAPAVAGACGAFTLWTRLPGGRWQSHTTYASLAACDTARVQTEADLADVARRRGAPVVYVYCYAATVDPRGRP